MPYIPMPYVVEQTHRGERSYDITIVSDDRWVGLQDQVVAHGIDPWSAADEMVRSVGA